MRTSATARRTRQLIAVALAVLAWQTLPATAEHAPGAAGVTVQANAFQPASVAVAPGGTVTWTVLDSGHTIVADDGRFAFTGDGPSGTLTPGDQRQFTVGATEEVVPYHCTIHGGPGGLGMSGVIVVGHPTTDTAPGGTVVRVPEDAATIAEAIAAIEDVPLADDGWELRRIEIAPGEYVVDDELLVDRDRLEIVGMGATPGDVRVIGGLGEWGQLDAVFHVVGQHVTIRNLSVSGARRAGVLLDDAEQASLRDVVVQGDRVTDNGVLVLDASGGGLHGVTVVGARRAGIRVEPCPACGIRIVGADVRDSLVGVLLTGALGVEVSGSTLVGNSAGIVARTGDRRLSTVTLVDNDVTENVARAVLPPPDDAARALATGAGIHLAGTRGSTVAGNRISGQTFGIAVSDGAEGVTVRDNVLSTNGTDLLWDGIGARTCFTGHGAPSSSPPSIESLYPCRGVTAGVPYPPAAAALRQAAYA